jgi:hypothetical protein
MLSILAILRTRQKVIDDRKVVRKQSILPLFFS